MAGDDQAEAVEFLSRGASYGRPGERPQRIDTHISHVFLIGDRVFKLKRAVRFSYLDFSQLADRLRFCQAELALNRRTAPALYLGLRSVTRRPDGGLEWDGDGALVEPVLEMRRFEDNALFDKLAEGGRLTPALIMRLADTIAAFHTAAEATPQYGGRDGLGVLIADNSANLRAGCPPLDRATVEALDATSAAALARCGALLDRRRMEGKVRRCHGDLHLRNICLFDGEPTLFDAIEFSDEFACIDVLFDLAFLLMDLQHHALRSLANRLFNRYFDRADETQGLGALPLFLSVRAAIRAKVALGAGNGADAKAYLDLALVLLRSQSPQLIAIGGLSGTGKSTVAASLAGDFAPAPGARHIRSDVLRKTLMAVAPETRLPPAAYTQDVSREVYRLARDHAAAALAAGYSVVVDATFIDPGEREAVAEVARKAGVPFTGLWLTAPEAVLMARVAGRSGDASDADEKVLQDQLRADRGDMRWQTIDVGGKAAAALAAVRTTLALA